MRRLTAPLLIAIGLLLVVIANTFYTVSQTQQAIVLRFGDAQYIVNQPGGTAGPGLYMKVPLIDAVEQFDKRTLGFTLSERRVTASDQQNLLVDAFVRWRIQDPLRFYQAARTEDGGQLRLEALAEAALRRALGNATQNEIITSQRAALMREVEADLNREAATELGVQIVDVRIRQADLPRETAERVYQRMRTEREQVAAEIRAKGEEQALRVRADADRQVVVERAKAEEDARRIRGEGDARRAKIFADSYGRNPEFAAFYRSMQAYERAIPAGTPIIAPADSDFFRYMRNRDGR
ncbi:MAG: protease modulator HflC [Alphaproteobacteria bacterium]|nr:protease modulator HflC [Alphaproteobacteria bacterium]